MHDLRVKVNMYMTLPLCSSTGRLATKMGHASPQWLLPEVPPATLRLMHLDLLIPLLPLDASHKR